MQISSIIFDFISMNINKVTLIGNVTDTPKLRTTKSGHSFTTFAVATNYFWKDANTGQRKHNTEFHSVIAWRGLAEKLTQYVQKGERLYVEGRLQTRAWKDQTGQDRKKTEIIASTALMLGGSKKQKQQQRQSEGAQLIVQEEVSTEEVPF